MALASPTPETAAHVGAIVNLYELSTDLLATAGPDGRFSELSPAWEATLGWTTAELTAKPYIDFVHPDDRERTVQVTARGRNWPLCRFTPVMPVQSATVERSPVRRGDPRPPATYQELQLAVRPRDA